MPALESIAEIRAGVTLRGRDATRPVPQGSHHLIRIGDIDLDGRIRHDGLIQIRPRESLSLDAILRPGDLLVAARGNRNTAAVFELEIPNALAGSQFFIIRPDPRINPRYLAWFLRSAPIRRHFETRRSGSYVQLIQRADLAEIEIPVPTLADQARIAEVANLAREESSIATRLAELRTVHLEQLLWRKIHPRTRIP